MTTSPLSNCAINAIRGLHAALVVWRRPLVDASLHRLLRQCDAKLPLLAPSLLDQPITEQRWLRYLRAEALRPRAAGTPMEKLAWTVRGAILHPECRKLETIVERWLPDEDPLREVVIATRDAIDVWWNEPSKPVRVEAFHILWMTTDPIQRWRDAALAALILVAPRLDDEVHRDLRDAIDRAHDRERMRSVSIWARDECRLVRDADSAERAFDNLASDRFPLTIAYISERFENSVRRDVDRACGAFLRARVPALDLERLWVARASTTADRNTPT
ncbi:MAG: hypothetical protein JNK05_36220 [Myxococcales bacterium]|nr:hypothetical protein [Myxococcales bacterium]